MQVSLPTDLREEQERTRIQTGVAPETTTVPSLLALFAGEYGFSVRLPEEGAISLETLQ